MAAAAAADKRRVILDAAVQFVPRKGPKPAPFTLDPAQAMTSLDRISDVDATWMLPGHGPAWNGGGRFLLWSDIPNNRQLRWPDEDGHCPLHTSDADDQLL